MRGPKRNRVVGLYVVSDVYCICKELSIELTSRGGGGIPLIRFKSKRLTAREWESEGPLLYVCPQSE
jgi:hypothetical protein